MTSGYSSRSIPRLAWKTALGAAHLWPLVLLILGWQVWVSVRHYNAIVLPTPRAVFSALIDDPGTYASHLGFTLVLAVAGLVLGLALGVLMAVMVWSSPVLSGLTAPVALALQAVPVVAMLPVIARLFGYNEYTELVITTTVCCFPAFVFTGSGLRRPPPGSADVLSVLGAPRRRRLRLVLLPGAVPNILIAIRIVAPLSVLAAMLAEFLMGTNGLGYFIALSTSDLQLISSWAAAILGTISAVIFFLAASRIEARGAARWT